MRSRESQSGNKEQTQSKLEKLHNEAAMALAEKREIIQSLNDQIDEAEKQCAQLKAELQAKALEMQDSESEDETQFVEEEEDLPEFVAAKQRHAEEIEKIKADQDEELKSLQLEFTRKLKAAEEWNNQHTETLKMDKQARIDELKSQLEMIKAQQTEALYTQTQARNKFYQESKAISAANEQKIQSLENQLSELQAVSREELRDIRAKIDECLCTVELRQQEHDTEIARYEKEISERSEKYNNHISALSEQLKNEKARIDQDAIAAETKIQSLEKVLAQMEKHHQKQVDATMQDIERMKISITSAKARGDQTIEATKTSATQVQTVSREVKQIQEEIDLVDKEIQELTAENEELKAELARLSKPKSETKKF